MFCILISGMPSTGKSTIALKISQQFNLPIYSKDSFKEVLFDTLGFSSRQEKVKLGIAATKLMYKAAEENMKANKMFILENNFEYSLVNDLHDLLNKYQYKTINIRLTGDYKLIYERFSNRDLNSNRHRGHVVNDCYPEKENAKKDNPTRKTYEQFIDDLNKRGFDDHFGNYEYIDIDVTDYSKIDYEKLFNKIQNIINN